MDEAIEISSVEPPEEITDKELDEIRAELLSNVNNGVTDVLNPLTPRHHNLLLRLAYHDALILSILEGEVQEAMRLARRGEPEAKRFNLRRYSKAVKEQKAKIAEGAARRARINASNLHIIDGGKPDEELRKLQEDAPGNEELQAKLYSQSAFLKATGTLEARMKGRIWFDTFYNNYFTDWDGSKDDRVQAATEVSDSFLLTVYEWLQMQDTKLAQSLGKSTAEDAVRKFGLRDIRNEPQEWLKKLEWDGTARLSSWLETVYGVEPNDYHSAVGRCWIMSMAKRIQQPGCKVDTMPVLIGPEGTRKSTSLGILGGKWYATINTSADKLQDFLMTLNGRLIGEIAELDAISRSTDSRIKTILSTASDSYRPPYGRVVKEFLRTCVLVGSTNDMHWHKEGGTRRYWPIICTKQIDTEWLIANREQLFAEAKVLLDGGALWYDVDSEEQSRRVLEHHTTEPWQDLIEAWLVSSELWTGFNSDVAKVFPDPMENEASKRWGTIITTARVLTECIQVPKERQDKRHSNKVAGVMRHLGFEQGAVRGPGGQYVRA